MDDPTPPRSLVYTTPPASEQPVGSGDWVPPPPPPPPPAPPGWGIPYGGGGWGDPYSTYGYGQQPYTPYGYGYPPAWQPPATPPASGHAPRRLLAALLMVLVVGGTAGAAAGVLIHDRANPANGTTSTSTSGNTAPGRANLAEVNINTRLGSLGAAAGTGMLISTDGYVLTNNHVVDGETTITGQVGGVGRTYNATVIGVDPTEDVAVIKLDSASGLPTIAVGDSSSVKAGDPVTAIGNALGKGGPPSITTGKVTALDQTVTATDEGGGNSETLTGMIQFDAPIQPGDSGGPLVNGAGQVVGMDTAGSQSLRGRNAPSNVGFAIPLNSAMSIAQQIISGKGGPNLQGPHAAMIGVEVVESTGTAGAQVDQVQTGSPAEGAGITSGSIITAIDGTTIDSVASLGAAIHSHKPGDKISVTWQDASGQSHTATVTLASGPPD